MRRRLILNIDEAHVLLGAIDPSRDDQDQKLKLESAHPRERTPGSESHAGPKAATAPAFRTLESFTFRIGRLLAHYGVESTDDKPIIYTKEPKTSWGRRFKVFLYGILPIKGQL